MGVIGVAAWLLLGSSLVLLGAWLASGRWLEVELAAVGAGLGCLAQAGWSALRLSAGRVIESTRIEEPLQDKGEARSRARAVLTVWTGAAPGEDGLQFRAEDWIPTLELLEEGGG